MQDSPILVVGVGRSGTSLVQSMLAAHPDLAIPPETSFLRRLVTSGTLKHALDCGGEAECARVLDADDNLRRTGIPSQYLLDKAMVGGCSAGSLYRSLLELYAERRSKRRYGDKDPRLVEYLPVVWAVFPYAQVVHVVRDPRDILASKKKAAWSKARGTLQHIFANRVQLKIGRKAAARCGYAQYQELVYEDLLGDPESELKKLCHGLKLRFVPEMLNFGDAAKVLVSSEEISWKRETLGPLLNKNKSKWKTELSGWEVALTELACGAYFEGGRYSRSGKIREITSLEKLWVYITWLGLATLDPIYRWYRAYTVHRAMKYL